LVNACTEERVMMMPLVSSFGDLALSFSSVFTSPSFTNFLTVLSGWVFCLGRHTVTGLIVAAGAAEEKHFSCFPGASRRTNVGP
jgi:hypothetical protein